MGFFNKKEAFLEATAKVVDAMGLHARPAALLAREAKKFESEITLTVGGVAANAKSVAKILSLGIAHGTEITLRAAGADQKAALAALVGLIEAGLDAPAEKGTAAAEDQGALETIQLAGTLGKTDRTLEGVSASPGIGKGKPFFLEEDTIDLSSHTAAATPQEEEKKFQAAIEVVLKDLGTLVQQVKDAGALEAAEIFEAHREIVEDPALQEATQKAIAAGSSAAAAWVHTLEAQIKDLSASDNPVIVHRVADLKDLELSLVRALEGKAGRIGHWPTEPFVLLARDLTPSQTATLPKELVSAIATEEGGPNAHASILARSLGIPSVVAVGVGLNQAARGSSTVVVNGTMGFVDVDPDPDRLKRIDEVVEKLAALARKQNEEVHLPCVTKDGHKVTAAANIATDQEAALCVAQGAEGVGLLRTELVFQNYQHIPSADEQTAFFVSVGKALGERPVKIRTYDVGGDKPVAFMPMKKEQNPFLGIRGIRLTMAYPDVFRNQIEAIYRAAGQTGMKAKIMLPMVSFPEEFRRCKAFIESVRQALGAPVLPVGMMVEVPSDVFMIEEFAKDADFFSIGTNDLTQYILAIDRGHPDLAKQADSLHPAVLRAIRMVVDGAHKYDTPVAVCGNMAAQPEAVPLLVGLGVDELSVSGANLPALKAAVRRLSYAKAQEMAALALSYDNAEAVRKLLFA